MKVFILLFFLSFAFGLSAQENTALLCSKSRIKNYENSLYVRETGNQNDFDLGFYKLYIDVNYVSKQISGKAEITCYSKINNLNELDFDITSSLSIKKIFSNNKSLSFEHNSDVLKVFLDKKYSTGQKITLTIEYYGQSGATFHFDTKYSLPMIWTLSEPYGSKDWWPCKNLPDDKLDSIDIIVTVQKNLIVASNGLLASTDTIENKIQYHWKERYPISSYLVSLAIYPYKIKTDYYYYDGGKMPVLSYIFASDYESDKDKYNVVPVMLEVLSSYYGQYPFIKEKYGNAQFLWGGGMEHQTLTSLLGPYEYLMVHELGHQWWGDMITCKDFHHIWLNEGFASYTEALWAEYKSGEFGLHSYMDSKKYLGHGTIYVDDISQSGRIFSGALSYNKASWVLHMLRHVVGDSTFFEILQQYAQSDKKYDVATTEDFAKICKNVSGMDLDRFFNQWIYGDYHPVYLYDWNYREDMGKYIVDLEIEQFQLENIFSMPIDITIKTGSGKETFVIQNDDKLQKYIFELNNKPISLILDENDWILKEVKEGIDMVNHDNSEMLLSVSSFGSFGHNVPDGLGYGLIFPREGENRLFYGSLIFGNSSDYVVDNSEKDKVLDFKKKENSSISIYKTNISNLDINTVYTDKNHPESKDVEINQTSYSWSLAPFRDFIIVKYDIKNKGNKDIDNLYIGQFMDFDIGDYLENYIDKNEDERLIYQSADNIFIGIKLLNRNSENPVFTGLLNAVDNWDENIKFDYLSGQNNAFLTDKQGDWSSLLSSGPYTLNAGDSMSISFAIIGGTNKDQLFVSADYAQSLFDHYLTGTDNIYPDQTNTIAILYPNPVNDKIHIEINSPKIQHSKISFYNVDGKKVYL
ncbi:MAG TPA: M1 family peptidase, partial [Bacteroidetes bacterium]|nr:M1 family peptidase [Bacteroidota bacterium]